MTHDLEANTPLIRVWEGVLAMPIVGSLDTARCLVMMEKLLVGLGESGSTIAILDISGVPTVDTEVALQLLKTIDAARLMGAECIVSGIRPEIAQTIVHLGIDLKEVRTRASMAQALEEALTMLGLKVVPIKPEEGP
jgi:rsbT co-antagonist protein RsbR